MPLAGAIFGTCIKLCEVAQPVTAAINTWIYMDDQYVPKAKSPKQAQCTAIVIS